MEHRIPLSTFVGMAMVAAVGGGLLAWMARDRGSARDSEDTDPDRDDMERLLEKFAAGLPRDEAEWMLRRGRDQLGDWE